MAACSSSFVISNVATLRNEVVRRKMLSQNFIFDGVRFRSDAKEVALTVLCRNSSFRHRMNSFSVKKKGKFTVMSMSEPWAESQSELGTIAVSNEGGGVIVEKETRIPGNEYGSKTESGANDKDMIDGSGGNGKYTNGRGGGGGGGDSGGDGDGGDKEEEEFGPVMKFAEIMKETEARGVSLPSDMIEAAKSVGIRKVLLLRYLDLQV